MMRNPIRTCQVLNIFSQSDYTIHYHDIQLCRDTWHYIYCKISIVRFALNDIVLRHFGISQKRPQWHCFTRNFHLISFLRKLQKSPSMVLFEANVPHVSLSRKTTRRCLLFAILSAQVEIRLNWYYFASFRVTRRIYKITLNDIVLGECSTCVNIAKNDAQMVTFCNFDNHVEQSPKSRKTMSFYAISTSRKIAPFYATCK